LKEWNLTDLQEMFDLTIPTPIS